MIFIKEKLKFLKGRYGSFILHSSLKVKTKNLFWVTLCDLPD